MLHPGWLAVDQLPQSNQLGRKGISIRAKSVSWLAVGVTVSVEVTERERDKSQTNWEVRKQ